MFYTIYKTTCLVNGKFYIGKHQTKKLNDGYFGSGKYLLRAVAKYGPINFLTEIIAVYEHEWQMNLAEKIFVVLDNEISYNLCPGGHGGFGYINSSKIYPIEKRQIAGKINGKKGINYLRSSEAGKICYSKHGLHLNFRNASYIAFLGKSHTDKTKKIIGSINSIKGSGKGNSQYGSRWANDGYKSFKIKKDVEIPVGLKLGRVK